MKKFYALKTLVLVAVSTAFSSYAYATCTANSTNISSACTDLVINADIAGTPPGTVDVSAAVTGSTSSYALRLQDLGNVTNLNINSGGSVVNSNRTALVNGGVIQNLNIVSGASIDASGGVGNGVAITNNYGNDQLGTIGTITNAGTIAGGAVRGVAIKLGKSGDSISTLNNTGTISGNIAIDNTGTIGTLTNSNSISGTIANSGTITSLTNTSIGTISSSNSAAINLGNENARITTLNNAGMISASNESAIAISAYGGSLAIPAIETLNNTGQISSTSGAGILVGGQVGSNALSGKITTLTNSGLIEGSTAGIKLQGAAEIGTLINTASTYQAGVSGIQSIVVTGSSPTILTLNNAQNNLSYNGSLPVNYNVIINNSANYGKLNLTGPGDFSNTNFGIAQGSVVPLGQVSTYSSVLSGFSKGNLSNTSGTYGGGGLFNNTWRLVNVSGSTWDLQTDTTKANVNTGSSSGNNLANAIAPAAVSSAGTTVLANGTSLAAAAQSLTVQQADQLSNVHAEGYSSNMTIGLEQMAHITNTVMDRIHNPISKGTGTSTAYEMDQGKYIWVDAAAVKGTVNSYDGLGGFGYNLYDAVIGGDIMRDSSGGLGVYAGAGYTTMTEPAQVSQNFNTTNYYAGLYGGKYLPYNFKLSGALGYMYGETNASRNNPNVGLFTGGTANSNYGTNGAYGAFKFSRPFQASESLTLTPYVGASYSQLWMGQANESGGNDFSYNISSATAYTTVTFVGGEFIMPLTGAVKNPMSLVGFYRFGYDWFANSAYAHSITANSSKFGSFNQIGADMGPALNLAGLGVQGNIVKGLSGRIGVVGSANTNGWQIGGGGELKWAL